LASVLIPLPLLPYYRYSLFRQIYSRIYTFTTPFLSIFRLGLYSHYFFTNARPNTLAADKKPPDGTPEGFVFDKQFTF
jgi:hypothetical protein